MCYDTSICLIGSATSRAARYKYYCSILSRVLPGGLARMEIVPFRTVRFETTPISVLNCNTSTQVASTGNLPPPFHTLAYNPYRLPEMDLAFRRRFFGQI